MQITGKDRVSTTISCNGYCPALSLSLRMKLTPAGENHFSNVSSSCLHWLKLKNSQDALFDSAQQENVNQGFT